MALIVLLALLVSHSFCFDFRASLFEYDNSTLAKKYAEALADAQNLTQGKIVTTLTPIRVENKKLIFDDAGRVLLATFSLEQDYPDTSGNITLTSDTWFTAVPELQNACQTYEGNKTLRILQALGMPPSDSDNGIAEIFVNLQDIFRPCPDPEISDMECELNIPIIGKQKPSDQKIPWYCPTENEKINEVSAQWVNVVIDHLIWMCNNWNGSYYQEELYNNYPWTGLGYTYDWGNSKSHVGFSEFVVKAGTQVYFSKKASTDDYCTKS
ncbi:unnamed protein product [Blepharisma stoltei]|uniref:Uncharacterized protein n=1 Tax=Blepharisma stoltei TaxID=1481888 RepID=A0AAU9K5G1_9CILI|nr:unnamed protein product [Blepharisma stoltei]